MIFFLFFYFIFSANIIFINAAEEINQGNNEDNFKSWHKDLTYDNVTISIDFTYTDKNVYEMAYTFHNSEYGYTITRKSQCKNIVICKKNYDELEYIRGQQIFIVMNNADIFATSTKSDHLYGSVSNYGDNVYYNYGEYRNGYGYDFNYGEFERKGYRQIRPSWTYESIVWSSCDVYGSDGTTSEGYYVSNNELLHKSDLKSHQLILDEDDLEDYEMYKTWLTEHLEEYNYFIVDSHMYYTIYFTKKDNLNLHLKYDYSDNSYWSNKVAIKTHKRASVLKSEFTHRLKLYNFYKFVYQALNGEIAVTTNEKYSANYLYNPLSSKAMENENLYLNDVLYTNVGLFYNPAKYELLSGKGYNAVNYNYSYFISNNINQDEYYINPLILTDIYTDFISPDLVEQPNAPLLSDEDKHILTPSDDSLSGLEKLLYGLFIPSGQDLEELYIDLINNSSGLTQFSGAFFDILDTVFSDNNVAAAPSFTLKMSELDNSSVLKMQDINIDFSIPAKTLDYVKNVSGLFLLGTYFFKEFMTIYRLLK